MKKLSAILSVLLSAAACYYLLTFCVLGFSRMLFPYALEWYESSMYYLMLRVLEGQALYVPPSIEYVPTIYPPVYIYATAALALIIGPEFFTLRIVSFLSSLGSMVLIGLIVYRETRSQCAGLWAAGLFAATYRLSATYLDIGRIDSLFLLLTLGTLAMLRFAPGIRGSVLAGVLLACAALTKQTAIVMSLPLLIYAFVFRSRLQALCFAGACSTAFGLISLLLNAASDGWYFYYVFDLPSQHPVLWGRAGSFWLQQILWLLGPAACLTTGYFFLILFKKQRGPALVYALIVTSLLAASCMHWMKIGGFKNVLIPAHAALALGAGLALGAVYKDRLRYLWYGAALIQFGLLWYNPLPIIPAANQAETCRQTVSAIAGIEGKVFAPANGYLAVMAGKKHSAHIGFINDILWGNPSPVRTRLILEIRSAIRNKQFAVILLDRPFSAFQRDIDAHYVLCEQYAHQLTYWPLIRYWYIPASEQP